LTVIIKKVLACNHGTVAQQEFSLSQKALWGSRIIAVVD
jgi:hypothetical protein